MIRGHLATIPATALAVATIRVYGGGFFVYGLATVLQSSERWSSPSYASATALAPPWAWGALVALFGLTTLAGSILRSFAFRNVGLYGIAVWLGMFGVAILDVARRDSHVSYGGPILYGVVCVSICLVARAQEGQARARKPPRL